MCSKTFPAPLERFKVQHGAAVIERRQGEKAKGRKGERGHILELTGFEFSFGILLPLRHYV